MYIRVTNVSEKCDTMKLINRYHVLQHEDSTEHGKAFERVGMTPIRDVGQSRKHVAKIKHKGLRISTCTWNFQGLYVVTGKH